ncbi:hypothetical protein Tco_0160113, partial [Tanacetum coccineum]
DGATHKIFVISNPASDNWWAKPSDSKNELSLRTFSMMNKTDGSGGVEGLVLISSWLFFSSPLFSSGLSSWDLLCFLGWIVMVLIEPWIWVERYGSSVG